MTDEFNCDICNIPINYETDEFYHFSGFINKEFNNHIHVCSQCSSLYQLHRNYIDIDLK